MKKKGRKKAGRTIPIKRNAQLIRMIHHAYHADRLDSLEKKLGDCNLTEDKILGSLIRFMEVLRSMKSSNFLNVYHKQPYEYLRERIDHEDNLLFGRINTVLMVQSILLLGIVTWIVSDNFSSFLCWIAIIIVSLIGGVSSFLFTTVGHNNIRLIRLLHKCLTICIDPKTDSEEPVHKIVRISNPSMSYLTLYSGTLWAFPFLWLGLLVLAIIMAIRCW